MAINPGMYSSATAEWPTPQWLFDKYHTRYSFTVDVCATHENAKLPVYYTEEQDGLAQEWSGRCWMNPPYGRQIGKWVEKAARSTALVVALLPARTDTSWFHNFVLPHGRIEFLRGRLKFGEAKNSAPFPSMIVTFTNFTRAS